jgi:cellulose synthase/poly-beta-1,6-N-acetylglucosamine synthase-like glycosyltransferase
VNALNVLVDWQWVVLGYFLLVNSFYLLLLLSAASQLRRHSRKISHEQRAGLLGSPFAPRISMLAPAYSEAATIVESVRALLTLSYPNLEVVLVNDGSTDTTLQTLQTAFDLKPINPVYQRLLECAPTRGLYRSRLTPELVVLDKENGGKADALNAALNLASGTLVCAIDADTLIETDALLRMVRPFLERSGVVATGGTLRVANGSLVRDGRVVDVHAPRRMLPGVQAVEYLRAFMLGRLGWNALGGNLIISGAFGLFARAQVIAAGGYEHDTVGEDMELVANLRRLGIERGEASEVAFIPDPVAWTEVPESLRVLGRQRERWQRGLADVLWRHRHVLARRRYGPLGLFVAPYFVLVELLAPLVEALGILGLALALLLGAVNWPFAFVFLLVAYGYGLLLSGIALLLEELTPGRHQSVADRLLMLGWAVLEPLGYRQLTVIWRLRGMIRYLRGRSDWGTMTRRGFAAQPTAPSTPAVSVPPTVQADLSARSTER